jgi:hypothetical protein
MAEQNEGVIIQYFTPDDRFGRQFGVASVHDALTVHPDARIIGWADGRPFDGKDAKAEVKEARAEIREERAVEREAAAPAHETAENPATKAKS